MEMGIAGLVAQLSTQANCSAVFWVKPMVNRVQTMRGLPAVHGERFSRRGSLIPKDRWSAGLLFGDEGIRPAVKRPRPRNRIWQRVSG